MIMTTTNISAAALSATFRRAGLNPVAPADRMREGVKVRKSTGGAFVSIDVDAPAAAARLADDVEAILAEQGYTFERDGLYFRVTGK